MTEAPRTAQDEASAMPHYYGHRDRLRERLRQAGADALADYELLELLLFRAIPRRDVKPLAKLLLARFGFFAEVISAPLPCLAEVEGLGQAAITELKIVQAAAQRLARGEMKRKTVLSSWSMVLDYCRAVQAFADKEQFRVLFLDKRNQLIADELQQIGTIDFTPVYPREVVKRALELSATAVILVHNHPSGDPTPSHADIQMTQQLSDIAKPLGIAVHDHIIVGKEGHASFKGLKRLPSSAEIALKNKEISVNRSGFGQLSQHSRNKVHFPANRERNWEFCQSSAVPGSRGAGKSIFPVPATKFPRLRDREISRAYRERLRRYLRNLRGLPAATKNLSFAGA